VYAINLFTQLTSIHHALTVRKKTSPQLNSPKVLPVKDSYYRLLSVRCYSLFLKYKNKEMI